MALRVITWNLMHGRADPPAGRYLLDEFTRALGGWEWDVALLQEVPPWWPAELAGRLEADWRRVLTSRNSLPALRRALAIRWPDLMRSNGGGANAILVRPPAMIAEERALRLCRLPERRSMHAVRLSWQAGTLWVGNLHASVRNDAAARREAALAARTLLQWAGVAPAVLGGDFNVRSLSLDGFALAGRSDVDHVFAAGLAPAGEQSVPGRGALSDHAPLLTALALGG